MSAAAFSSSVAGAKPVRQRRDTGAREPNFQDLLRRARSGETDAVRMLWLRALEAFKPQGDLHQDA